MNSSCATLSSSEPVISGSMKYTALLALGFLGTVPPVNAGSALISGKQTSQALDINARALPSAPNGYAPAHVTCPSSRPTIRSASTLSTKETTWLKSRRQKTETALKGFFGHVEIHDFDAVSYLTKHSGNYTALPNIAIGISGGGLVSLQADAQLQDLQLKSGLYKLLTSSETLREFSRRLACPSF
ncbi:unnamed protein product [Penicillium glandicola]